MNKPSYRRKILDTMLELATSSEGPTNVNFDVLAKHLGIKVAIISSEFKDMSELIYEASIEKFKQHESRSVKITQIPVEYALATLLRHDLNLIFLYARDAEKLTAINPENMKAVQYVKDYIDNKMPKFYFDILRFNPKLLPHSQINAKLYSNFIVHSMFFFTKKELSSLNPDTKELQNITQKIITQLFSTAQTKSKIDAIS